MFYLSKLYVCYTYCLFKQQILYATRHFLWDNKVHLIISCLTGTAEFIFFRYFIIHKTLNIQKKKYAFIIPDITLIDYSQRHPHTHTCIQTPFCWCLIINHPVVFYDLIRSLEAHYLPSTLTRRCCQSVSHTLQLTNTQEMHMPCSGMCMCTR